ncbi:hypothetical protein BSKO_03450 [Bryopsis sp. KO-2023]|nr:hypothetical protein BSKO_03450 [Bryopsis sp. KO-2023]
MRAVRALVDSQKRRPRDKVFKTKIISMGENGVGKSCLIKRYCEGKFISKYVATIGVDYGVKPVDFGDFEVRMNLWDLAGGGDYLDIRMEFYKGAQGGILAYDSTNRSTFEALDRWMEESTEFGAAGMVVIVVATKCDVPSQKVSEQEGREWASSKGFLFFQVSSATGHHVVPMFATLFARVMATIQGIPEDLVSEAVHSAAHYRDIEDAQL